MKAEEYQQRELEIEGWPVKLVSYRLGETYHCTLDNVSPGATIARTTGSTREEAESKAIRSAGQKLAATTRRAI